MGHDPTPWESISLGKSPEAPALDPTNAELNGTLLGTHTQGEQAQALKLGRRLNQTPDLGIPQLTQPESFQSHGTVEEGQILPVRKRVLSSLPLLGPVLLSRDTTNHLNVFYRLFSGHVLLFLQHPVGHTTGHPRTTALREW